MISRPADTENMSLIFQARVGTADTVCKLTLYRL